MFAQSWGSPWSYWPSNTAQQAQLCSDVRLSYNGRHVKRKKSFEAIAALFAGRDLVNMAKQRPNVIPIIEDARHPAKYRMLVPMVDVIFADVAQPDQVGYFGSEQSTSAKGLTSAQLFAFCQEPCGRLL